MKIITYLLAALLVAALGAAAFFYVNTFEPMNADYTRMKAGMPELDKAKSELKNYKEKEAKETAWINPVVETLKAGLGDLIKSGKSEVVISGKEIVVNISEEILYTPGSITFSKESPSFLEKLAALLNSNEIKGKEITVGNITDPVPAQGKGKKKIPPKDGRTLASDRSMQLVKYLEKNKVGADMLIAAAYPEKTPDRGFRIKDHTTIITIRNRPAALP